MVDGGEEGADGADRLVDGGGRELAFALEMDQEVEDWSTFEVGEMLVRVMVGELPDPAEVGMGGSLAETFELDKTSAILIPLP